MNSEKLVPKETLIVVWVTFPSEEEAIKTAKTLIEQGLAACVQVSAPVRSFYLWQQDVQEDQEWRIAVKTQLSKFSRLKDWVLAHHSYEVPQIIAVPVCAVSETYEQWMNDTMRLHVEKQEL